MEDSRSLESWGCGNSRMRVDSNQRSFNLSAALQLEMLKRRQFLKFSASPNTQPDGYWLHLNRPAMACRFEVTLPISDRAGTSVARNALAEADRHEQQLTIFRENSEVSYINRTAASRP